MAQQTINVGTAPNDGTGTPLRTAFQYTNSNFSELYTAVGPSGNNIVVPGNATITGDLTVDTNTFKVDSANNFVAVGTASPVTTFTVSGEASLRVNDLLYWNAYYNSGFKARAAGYASNVSGNTAGDFVIANTASSAAGAGSSITFFDRYRISNSGVHTWEYVGGVAGTAMTLNSTGLGVGMSPSASLSVLKSSATQATGLILRNANGADGSSISLDFETSAGTSGTEGSLAGRISGRRVGGGTTGALDFFVNNGGTLGTAKMTLDASGNLAIGDTATGTRRLEVKSAGTSNTTFAAHFRDSADTLLFHVRSDGYFNTGQGTLSPYNNTTASAANMYVDSSGFVYRSTSSLKYKTDVKDSVHGLADVLKLRPVTYKAKNGDDTIFGGLIAEEVHAAGLTEFVAYAPDNTPDAIHYSNMVSLLVAAIKELTARVQTLETR